MDLTTIMITITMFFKPLGYILLLNWIRKGNHGLSFFCCFFFIEINFKSPVLVS